MLSSITEALKSRGELRVEDFTEERIASLSKQIDNVYESGTGISGKVFSEILFGYQQELRKYEGIAYHFFGLVVTRDSNRKNSPLFLVKKDEINSAMFPVAPSAYHNLSVKKAIDSVWEDTSEPSISTSSSIISSLFNELSNIYSKLSDVFSSK